MNSLCVASVLGSGQGLEQMLLTGAQDVRKRGIEGYRWVQLELARLVRVDAPLESMPKLVAGVDVAYESDSSGAGRIAGAVVVLDIDSLSVVDSATAGGASSFPYIPGLLAFREVPILLEALDRLNTKPDLLVCDGYGVAHPRRCGLASHLAVVTGIPAFGPISPRPRTRVPSLTTATVFHLLVYS